MPPDQLEKPPTPEEEARDRRAANIFLLVAGLVLALVWDPTLMGPLASITP